MKALRTLAFGLALVAAPAVASAQTWTNWTANAPNVFSGTLLGSGVTFTGPWVSGSQLSGVGGTDYWTPIAPYTQGGLLAPNTGGNLGFIKLYPASSGILTFATPLTDVYLALISVGQPGLPVTYTFNQAFTVVSNNNTNCAYWGCGSYTVSGNSLIGREFSGTLKFSGSLSQLAVSTSPAEYWHGFSVGAASATAVVPEPATLLLLGTGLVGVVGVAARRRKQDQS